MMQSNISIIKGNNGIKARKDQLNRRLYTFPVYLNLGNIIGTPKYSSHSTHSVF